MIKVYIIEDAFEPKPQAFETESLIPFLMSKWEKLPSNAAIYHESIAAENNVTPKTQAEIDKLAQLQGTFYVVLNPGDFTFWAAVIIAAVAVAAVVLMPKPNIPSIRNQQAESPNNELSSRENRIRLTGRIPDIYGEVIATPDLIGVPYFVYVNHKKVEYADLCLGRGEYEFSQVRAGFWEIKDGDTLIQEIDEAGIEVYKPFSTIDSDVPQIKFGSNFAQPMRTVKRIEAVNGQTLSAYNEESSSSIKTIRFTAPNTIYRADGNQDLTQLATVGQRVTMSSAVYPINWLPMQDTTPLSSTGGVNKSGTAITVSIAADGGAGPPFSSYVQAGRDLVSISLLVLLPNSTQLNLSGTYAIASVGSREVTLSQPWLVNAAWNQLPDGVWNGIDTGSGGADADPKQISIGFGARSFNSNGTYTVLSVNSTQIVFDNPIADNLEWYYINGQTAQANLYIQNVIIGESDNDDTWVGPFTMYLPNTNNIIANVVATQGMYKDNGEDQISTTVDFTIEAQQVNAAGLPIGSVYTLNGTVTGSALSKSERAQTVMFAGSLPTGTYTVRAKRVTPKDMTYKGTVVDEIKWADLYAVAPVTNKNFGNVTIIRSKTTATTGALAVKSRKLNCRVTRKVKLIQANGTLAATRSPTKRVADIIADICFDPFLGNRLDSEVDLSNLKATGEQIETYFGHEKAQQFCYTFDKPNMSFEETMQLVADAVFSVPYREGNKIKLSFERQTSDSVLLLNHRNKLPGSEKRTYKFGTEGNTDGTELEYVAPEDFASVTYYIPVDRSAVNPQTIEKPGVANPLQAYFHAWRAENKRLYRRLLVECDALQEASILMRNSRVLIADNTRRKVLDGEVVAKVGLKLELSQPTNEMENGSAILLQHVDGSIESINCTKDATNEYTVTLAAEPKLPLSLDMDNYARTAYWIVGPSVKQPTAFLVTERESQDNMTSHVTAMNYDARYYSKDADYKNGIVNANGV